MRTHLTALLAAAGLAALSACAAPRATAPAAPPAPAAAPVKDRDLGLSKTSVFEVPAPPAWKAEDSAPGEKTPPPPRLGTQIPPVVPHGVADLLPITLRRAPDQVGEKVAGARWICTACHVARTDAPPLVGSRYRP